MPTDPLVCAILLTRDRPAMARRAIQAFLQQTYQRKRLIIWNTGTEPPFDNFEYENVWMPEVDAAGCAAMTIGALRNLANKYAAHSYTTSDSRPDIFIHWDDDDVSHPARIAEQVALLQASGKECVGYRECLFWKEGTRRATFRSGEWNEPGEAWLYTKRNKLSDLPGSSLCYWRRTWERKPFPDRQRGEDYEWCSGLNTVGVSCIPLPTVPPTQPRLIASIHAGNAANYPLEEMVRRGSQEWKRVPDFDDYCRGRMAL